MFKQHGFFYLYLLDSSKIFCILFNKHSQYGQYWISNKSIKIDDY
jgi:hypothetical protein